MTVYDAAMLGLVLLGMIWGAWKGAVWQAAGLISLALGYSVAHPHSIQLASSMPGSDPLTRRMGAMLLLYVLTSGGVFMVAWMIRSFLRKIRLQAYDRHLGMLLGGAGGAAAGLVGTLFVTSMAPDTRPMIFHSVSGKLAARALATLETRLPAEARAELAPFWSGEEGVEIAQAAGEAEGDRPARVALHGTSTKSHDDDSDEGVPPPLTTLRDAPSDDDDPTPPRRTTNSATSAGHHLPADAAEKSPDGGRPRFGQRASRWFENMGRSLTHSDPEDANANADADARRR
jgi:membrane protein required for colicin V production